jgi:crotonobetaine/carnitine-CoA ligase
VPDGSPGEAIVRGREPFVTMAGYWGKPQVTGDSLRDGSLHTGDVLARRPDGSYTFVDRMSDRIRRRGENISPLCIEQEALAHPDLDECAVIGAPGEFSEDEIKIGVSLRPGAQRSGAGLTALLAPRLSAFKVPGFAEILPELPKTPTGKIRKDVLRASAAMAATPDGTV